MSLMRTGPSCTMPPAGMNRPTRTTQNDPLWFLPADRAIGPFRFVTVQAVGGKTLSLEVTDLEGVPFVMKIPTLEASRDASWRGRFEREVGILRQLVGPAFPMLRAFGRYTIEGIGTVPYIVTAPPIGPTLRDLIAQRRAAATRPDVNGAPFLLRSLMEALSESHDKGVIHRNLRPDKIAIADNQVQILDFLLGLASTDEDDDGGELGSGFGGDLTRDRDFLGTPDYIAPEQARRAHDVDGRADLYSVGLILFEYLTYDRPFGQSQGVLDALTQHLLHDAPPPSSRNVDIPADLNQIVLRLTRRKREERFQSADEVIAAVDDLLQGRSSGAVSHICPAPASGKIGTYRIREALATAGKTARLRVEDARFRSFIMKVPSLSGATSPAYLERFRREVEILNEVAGPSYPVLRHSGTYEAGEHRALPYLVIDPPPGLTVREVIDQRRTQGVGPDLGGAPRLLRKLALVLAEVHAKGIFPCNVRPDSVAVHEGEVRLLEFVLGQGAANESVLAAGKSSALASYDAPEQLALDQPVDARADLYALGVLLYEYLTFELPHGAVAGRQEALLRSMTQASPAPSSRQPSIAPGLDSLVQRLLARRAADRPSSAYAVADEAARLL
ncbi:MAG: hypothetical protein EOO75_03855 [Myxococcales bacterium]|nr:MAG: hypothetical protein EOO75_03855 [Myxococcales bacterium]